MSSDAGYSSNSVKYMIEEVDDKLKITGFVDGKLAEECIAVKEDIHPEGVYINQYGSIIILSKCDYKVFVVKKFSNEKVVSNNSNVIEMNMACSSSINNCNKMIATIFKLKVNNND